jgi:Tfp pilus assembly protein PilP
MKKIMLVLLAIVMLSGCGAGLIVNVNSIVDQYRHTNPQIEPRYSVKAYYYPTEYSYRALRKRIVWSSRSVNYTPGALIITDTHSLFLAQRQDVSVTTIFSLLHIDVEDVYLDKYSKSVGLSLSTSGKTYLMEIAKGIVVDKEATYDIYNFLLLRTQNKKNRQPVSFAKKKSERERLDEEQRKPMPQVTAPEKPITSPPTHSLGTTIIFTWDFSVAKAGPGHDYPVIATFRKGDKLTILEQSGKWVKVQSEKNQVGWVRSEVLE